MASWSEFTNAAPSLAAAIRAALHQYGAGLGYLATIRPDGGPRIHPVSPAVVGGGLYCCLLDTPKRRDLDRDGRYALHAFPAEETDDEASVRGSARLVTDPGVVRRVAAQLRAETRLDWWLYELTVDTALFVRREDESQQLWTDPRRPRRVVESVAVCGSAAHLDLDLRRYP
jgi:hypothetical protein